MRIGDHLIADDERCYAIADVGHNHQGSVERFKDSSQPPSTGKPIIRSTGVGGVLRLYRAERLD